VIHLILELLTTGLTGYILGRFKAYRNRIKKGN
jgi:hypothetical protein